MGQPPSSEAVAKGERDVQTALNTIDRIWLKDGKNWLVNDDISIADLLAYEEIAQV